MALTSALFTGLSGLDVNQARLQVIGNNIANVNTIAFKSSRALFKTQFYVTDSDGTPSSATFGGSNPSQRGLGATVGEIEKNFDPGSIEPTGKPTDLAIDGNGFFIVQGTSGQRFTRDGTFSLNDNNQLVTSSGDFLQGYGVDANGAVKGGKLQNIVIPLGSTTIAEATRNITLKGNLNADGVVSSGASVFDSQAMTLAGGAGAPTLNDNLVNIVDSGTGLPLFNSGDVLTQSGFNTLPATTLTVTPTTTLGDLANFFNQSLGINTDPALPQPAGAQIVSAGGNNVFFQLVGNTGDLNALSIDGKVVNQSNSAPLNFSLDAANNPSGESATQTLDAYDSLGTPLKINVTATLESKSSVGDTWRFYVNSPDNVGGDVNLGDGTLTFDNQGRLLNSTGTNIQIDRANTGADSPQKITLDFSQMTSLTDTTVNAKSEIQESTQDGNASGQLSSFSIGDDGTITGSYTNGVQSTLGQVAIATFNNPLGLVDQGGNQYTAGPSSGIPVIGAPGDLGTGTIRSGALELSNVDLSTEFTNLIIATTGFSASSRVITTSDQLITELLNSNR